MGAWLSYGLGSENSDLPTFVVLASGMNQGQNLHTRYWGSGFLPSEHQGVRFRPAHDAIPFVNNPAGVNRNARRRIIDSITAINNLKGSRVFDPEISTRIKAYEMAFRMQASVPELMDISGEPDHVLKLYGPEVNKPGSAAANCLLARRLAERGVRFVQLYHRGWDQHGNLPTDLSRQCLQTDQPSAALIQDLKMRGLLEDTLVVWATEFGRTPKVKGNGGRDHHPNGFSAMLAGGGVKGGISVGETDENGRDPFPEYEPRDLHATIATALGMTGTKIRRLPGRPSFLGGKPKPIKEILA